MMRLDLAKMRKSISKATDAEFEKTVLAAGDLHPEMLQILMEEANKRGREYPNLKELVQEYREKGYPEFFAGIGHAEIERTVQFLKERLPKKCTLYNYQLSHEMLGAQYLITQNVERKLQRIADMMREHLLIEEPIRIMMIDHIGAGKFEMIDNLSCIFINSDTLTQNFHQKVAILAHEMCHYYLIRKHGIIKEIDKENELLTEIGSVYIGFGFLLLKGYEENKIESGKKITTSRVGYISTEVVRKSIVSTAYARKQQPKWIVKNAGLAHKPYFYFKLRELRKQYKSAVRAKEASVAHS
ncbi:hypothetical protein FUAX_04880 [Fulvitalea axinellae]|uniref:Uncharacterized protein n=1 Tax=Fulvitalea axinellae TaxID=1182444 RepID=A0AAU9CH14_9BACT|nr:hypothetical protein FUAX_04880 [Fulvitalea axinellae]